MKAMNDVVISMKHISKQFGGIYALKGVDFELRREIHAIVGHNGAGKSTLMKILMGALRQDEGEIRMNGQLLHLNSPREALEKRSQWCGRSWRIFPT